VIKYYERSFLYYHNREEDRGMDADKNNIVAAEEVENYRG
jgi:hypothetical protein